MKISIYSFLFFIILFNVCLADKSLADTCEADNSKNKIINFNKDFQFCYGEEGVTLKYFNKIFNFQFIDHIQSQFYFIKTLPTGFRCRGGVLVGRAIPPTKYQPENAIYIYKLIEGKYGLIPIDPVQPATINHGKYLMTLARHEGRRMKALALLRYNGSKEISDGEILFLPLSNNNLKEFKVKKCRVEMTEHAKIINKLTVKRR